MASKIIAIPTDLSDQEVVRRVLIRMLDEIQRLTEEIEKLKEVSNG